MAMAEELVSTIELKELARKFLKSDSVTRNLILSEPDTLPAKEVLTKIEIFSKLLNEELKIS